MQEYLSPEDKQRIQEASADTADVAQRLGMTQFKHKTNKLVGDCPGCGARDGLEIITSGSKRHIFKCFHCDEVKGKGGAALLQNAYGVEWREAYKRLAEMYHIELTKVGEKAYKNDYQGNGKTVSFRDLQLRHSGIPNEAQRWMMKVAEGKWMEQDRYSAGTMSVDGKYIATGDDLVLHYIDLDEQPILFRPEKSAKEMPLLRVRYQHPDLHVDKEGNPVKYRSPRNSGSHLWLPQSIIEAWKKAADIETLYVVEGEKKADKMCLHGLPAVGIMGIHNLALNQQMPRSFELLITKCRIKNVVFVLDSDWQDISAKPGKPADARPYTFFKATLKFRDYFYGFRNSGIDIGLYLCAGKEKQYKGMDDLLSFLEGKSLETLKQPGTLAGDISHAMTDAAGEGNYVVIHRIHPVRMTEYQLKMLWSLESNHKFIERHAEELKQLGEFKIGKLLYFYDKEMETDKDLERFKLAQQILPDEQFWEDCSYTMTMGARYWITVSTTTRSGPFSSTGALASTSTSRAYIAPSARKAPSMRT